MDHSELNPDEARRLKTLRGRIEEHDIPSSRLDESLNLAIWNVRDFGKKRRTKDALHMIAEVIYQFDLVAFVELGANLKPLRKVMDLLGPYWRIVYNDITPGYAGNQERIGFLYDKRMVTFNGFAAELSPRMVRPKGMNAAGKKHDYVAEFGIWRQPYMASFRAGTFDFIVVATHIRYDSKHEERRVEELEYIAEWIGRWCKSKHMVDRDIIVLGDFNTPSIDDDDAFFNALTSAGLRVPASLRTAGHTNFAGGKQYDHILYYPGQTKTVTNKGGVFRFANKRNCKALFPALSPTEFTYKLSDHYPVWVQLNTDTDDERLDQLINRN